MDIMRLYDILEYKNQKHEKAIRLFLEYGNYFAFPSFVKPKGRGIFILCYGGRFLK